MMNEDHMNRLQQMLVCAATNYLLEGSREQNDDDPLIETALQSTLWKTFKENVSPKTITTELLLIATTE